MVICFQGGIVTSEDDDIKFEPVKMQGQENNHVIKKRWTANVVRKYQRNLIWFIECNYEQSYMVSTL